MRMTKRFIVAFGFSVLLSTPILAAGADDGTAAADEGIMLPASAGFHNPPTSISAARQAMMPE